jgi:CubicO group peptidase (beta-lactamase class C family)
MMEFPMRHGLVVLSAVAMLTAGAPVGAQDLLLQLFEEYLDSLRRQAGIPGMAAAIVGENDILWERGFGLQDIEASIAARPDTPFQIDGLTQTFTASLALRCAEDGTLSLDDRIERFDGSSPEANATVWQLLTHTASGPGGLVFNYRPERLAPFNQVVPKCIDDGSFRETLANILERFAMRDSVPGLDAAALAPDPSTPFDAATLGRYRRVLQRLAAPYAVDRKGRATRSEYAAKELTPADGMISTVRDLAGFIVGLQRGELLRHETQAAALQAPASNGGPLPHAAGWFVQVHNGQRLAWQFGVGPNASSSLIIRVPGRALTLIVLANSDGLAASVPLAAGDVNVSPFARLFLHVFIR